MVAEDMLDVFLKLLDHISDDTIRNYLKEVGEFHLPKDVDTSNTEIIYFYGGKINEIVFKSVGKYISKHYQNSTVVCLKGKGHCEDALLHPEQWIKTLNNYL